MIASFILPISDLHSNDFDSNQSITNIWLKLILFYPYTF
jgi:hypothetical protein